MRLLPLALAALLLPLSAMAATETVDGIEWTYTVSDGKVSFGGGSSSSTAVPKSTTGAITVPSTLGGYPVTSIGEFAFYGCSGLSSVTIPDSVTSIWDYAFSDCSGLASVTIPNSVTIIWNGAFSYCSGLTSVTIPASVTTIWDWAFSGCSGLTSVAISNSVTFIGDGAFSNCSGLKSVTIPDSVTSTGYGAFAGCSDLASVTISDSVTSIGEWVFSSCSSLKSVTIPDSVTSIREWAFYGCSSLASVTIPDSVMSIGEGAFEDCSGLKSVTIPDSVTSIGEGAFYGCSSLASVTIPDSVMSIGERCFAGCSGLKTLYLPSRFEGHTLAMGISPGCSVVFYSGKTPSYTYSVMFNANGGKLPSGKKMPAQKFTYNKSAALRKNAFTRKDYIFLGWATSKSGAVKYKNAQSVKNLSAKGGTVTLYAKWAKKSYKVAFYANGAKGKMAVESMTYGKAKKLSANKFKRKGYVFIGWAKSKADAKKGKIAYANKKSVKNLVTNGKTVKLYAVWKKK